MALIHLYSHDGDGLGHLRRNVSIAQTIVRKIPDASCLLLTGSPVPGAFGLPERCDHIKIPTLGKGRADNGYSSPLPDLVGPAALKLRQSILETAVKLASPDLLIVDKHPQGLNGELLPALRWLKAHSPATKIVLGLRDILDGHRGVQRDWHEGGGAAAAEQLYDEVWLYSDEHLCPTADICKFSTALRRKSVYTGYIVTRSLRRAEDPPARPTVVGTVGGGRDGFPVLASLIAACSELRSRHPKLRLRLFSGPLMPEEDARRLRDQMSALGSWLKMQPFSDRYLRALRDASAVVTMGGYNSLLECMALSKPTIVVPREKVRCEQLLRAEMFAARGALRIVRRSELEGSVMRRRLGEILAGEWTPTPMRELDFQGYRTIIHQISAMLRLRSSEVTPCAFLQS